MAFFFFCASFLCVALKTTAPLFPRHKGKVNHKKKKPQPKYTSTILLFLSCLKPAFEWLCDTLPSQHEAVHAFLIHKGRVCLHSKTGVLDRLLMNRETKASTQYAFFPPPFCFYWRRTKYTGDSFLDLFAHMLHQRLTFDVLIPCSERLKNSVAHDAHCSIALFTPHPLLSLVTSYTYNMIFFFFLVYLPRQKKKKSAGFMVYSWKWLRVG